MDSKNLPEDFSPLAVLDAAVEAALDAYPLVPTPRGFTAWVMAEVRQPRLIFRLEFIDLALPTFFAFFSAGILAVTLYILLGLDRLTRLQLELQGKIWLTQIFSLPERGAMAWLPLVVASCVLLITGMIGIGIWTTQRPALRMEE
jgi:hypothetical protein